MIPNLKILRFHEEIGEYEIKFSKKDIFILRKRFHDNGYDKNFNLNHEEPLTGMTMTSSFLVDKENRKNLPEEFKNLPFGTWVIIVEVTQSTFEKLKENNATGFSVEGTFKIFRNKKSYTIKERFRIMNKLSDRLPFDVHIFGGSTSGAGRNEHGNAHFQIKERNTLKDLGKIYMPSLVNWQKSNQKEKIILMQLYEGQDIATKHKKFLIDWLEQNNNENLLRCHAQWNESNKDNNRTTLI